MRQNLRVSLAFLLLSPLLHMLAMQFHLGHVAGQLLAVILIYMHAHCLLALRPATWPESLASLGGLVLVIALNTALVG